MEKEISKQPKNKLIYYQLNWNSFYTFNLFNVTYLIKLLNLINLVLLGFKVL